MVRPGTLRRQLSDTSIRVPECVRRQQAKRTSSGVPSVLKVGRSEHGTVDSIPDDSHMIGYLQPQELKKITAGLSGVTISGLQTRNLKIID